MFNGADWTILAIVLISAAVGLFRGLVKEVLSLVIWVVALVVAILFRVQVAAALPIDDPNVSDTVREILAFALLFFGVLIAGGLINHLVAKLIEITGLTGTDRVLGGCFGLGRGLVLVLVALVFLPGLVPVDEAAWWRDSVLIPRFLAFEDWARQVAADLSAWIAATLE